MVAGVRCSIRAVALRPSVRLLLTLGLLAAGEPLQAQGPVRVPPPGAPERRELLDVVRPQVQREMAGAVVFHQVQLRIAGEWAFIYAEPRGRSGERFDAFRARCECDDIIYALLRRRGGRWTIVRLVVGATDVSWVTWDRDYGAPRGIFPWPE
jgi:hypothetical protein